MTLSDFLSDTLRPFDLPDMSRITLWTSWEDIAQYPEPLPSLFHVLRCIEAPITCHRIAMYLPKPVQASPGLLFVYLKRLERNGVVIERGWQHYALHPVSPLRIKGHSAAETPGTLFPEHSPLPPGLRFRILKRDNSRCRLCGVSAKDGKRLEVDHITPRSRGGTNDPMNLWTLCFDCNRGKGTQEL